MQKTAPKKTKILMKIELSIKSHPVFFTLSLGQLSAPYPLFQWYLQSKEIFIKSLISNAENQHLVCKKVRFE
jgi:hypothetical protein